MKHIEKGITNINLVIEDLEMLKNGVWIPDEHSCNSSIENLKEASELLQQSVIDFAEWIRERDFQTASDDKWIGLSMKRYTTKELFEIWKNQKDNETNKN